MAERRPMAFMSYAHVDDEFNKGRLTEFSQCLSREVSLHLGDDFPIFLDRKDLKWGDSWKERIGESIDCTTFLIPIITPSFFNSNYCRDELNRFLDRERKLGRNDLILPVYFIHTSLLHDESKMNGDNLAQTIASRQYADWRKLRHKKFDSEEVCEALDNLAAQIREALESLPPASEEHALKSESPTPVRNKNKPSAAVIKKEIEKIRNAAPKSEASTIVVDQMHRGDFATISQAISAADPGSRILVKSGIYDEGLVLDKPLEIVGDGEIGEVVIRASEKDAILFKTVRGKISNLLIRQVGGGDWCGVNISQGCLELGGCDITSDGSACIAVHGNAYPRIIINKIHGSKGYGIYVYEDGQGLIEGNEIYSNVSSGIEIKDGGNPTIKHNKIHDGKVRGILVRANSQCLIEDNEIYDNAASNVTIMEGGNPTLRKNKIHDGKDGGIFILENGQGVIEDNEIYGNALAGVGITEGGNPTLRRNKIHDGKGVGIQIYKNGQGIIEDNEIYGNALSGVAISEGGNPTIKHNHINKNSYNAIWIYKSGAGTIEDNDLRENKMGPWDISKDSKPLVKRTRNQEK